jgi:uncharacterized DUF497 family protein
LLIGFDTVKEAANLSKHGVSLAFGARLFDDPAQVIAASFRPVDGEERYKIIGMVDGSLWTAVHVRRGAMIRMISVRRSNASERLLYDRDRGGPE